MKKIFSTTMAMIAIVIIGHSQANQKLSNLISPTAVNVPLLPDSNNKRNFGSPGFSWRNLYLRGDIYIDGARFVSNVGTWNTFVGTSTGSSLTTGEANTAIGFAALTSNTNGVANTASGSYALRSNTNGNYNTATGNSALFSNLRGSANTASGDKSLYYNTTGNYNTAIGNAALFANTTGNYNTAIGNEALVSNTIGNYNTASGFRSLYFNKTGINNTASGVNALYANNDGYNNTASGTNALQNNNSGTNNTASGFTALLTNTNGSYNTASGVGALYSNVDGNNNTAAGANSLNANQSGYSNTASGAGSLFSNNTGHNNTATGANALNYNTAGNYNTASGVNALYNNTTGYLNSAFGLGALFTNTTGSYNTAIGYAADVSGSFVNGSAFGYNSTITANNQVRIGNSLVTSIGGYAAWTTLPSDGRVKKNIKANVPGLAFINKLQPLTYNLDIDAIDKIVQRPAIRTLDGKSMHPSQEELAARKLKEQITYTGFIAQDVQKAARDVGYDFSGVDPAKNDKDLYGIRYAEFVVPLVKAVQELSVENDELKSRLTKLEEAISLKSNPAAPSTLTTARLEQNAPNPSRLSTRINYYIPQNVATAVIKVTDANGQTIKTVSLTSRGHGYLNLQTTELSAGTYAYTLILDGKLIDTKKMLLAK